MTDFSQFVGAPLGVAALWIFWKLATRALGLYKDRLAQLAAKEVAEREERIAEVKAQREERARESHDQRAERREERDRLFAMTAAIAELTKMIGKHVEHSDMILAELRAEIRQRENTPPDARQTGPIHYAKER